MAEEIAFKNGRISYFQELVDFNLDHGLGHTAYHPAYHRSSLIDHYLHAKFH